MKKFKPGDRVRFTAIFLRNTGQAVGGEGHSVWTVVAHPNCVLCKDGRFVQVNEPATDQDDVPPGAPPRLRHINAANLIKTNKPDYSGM